MLSDILYTEVNSKIRKDKIHLNERTFHFYLYKIVYSTTEGQRYIKRGNESTLNPGKQFKIRNLYMSQALNIKK